jgi:glycosyltransferase involved in cell wall biosynthesis
MNIWLVSIFEQTPVDKVFSTRFLSIAEEALSRGHQVTFFGSTFKHNTKEQRFAETTIVNQATHYNLVFVKSDAYVKNVSIKRLNSHAKLGKDMVKEFGRHPKPDVILLAFPPISLGYEVSKWTNENKVPLVMDIIDPWPDLFEREVPVWATSLAKPVFAIPKKRVGATLKNVNTLTAISNQYLNWADQYFSVTQKECLYPAADYAAIRGYIDNAESLELAKKKLNIIYAGSLASSYDIDTILAAASSLSSKADIHFFLAGAGPQEEKILSYTEKYENLTFLGRLAKDDLMRYYAHCDLGMTQHIKGATQSVTYKLFDLLAAGLPILNSLESEMKDIMVNNEVGLHNDPGDGARLKDNILEFYNHPQKLNSFKKNGLKLAEEVGDTKVIYKRFVNLLEEQCH